jgi:dUTP pyrophosphatase
MNIMKLKIKPLRPEAYVPAYATVGAACFDIATCVEATVPAGDAISVATGLAFEIPEGHVMLVFSRSGHGFKSGVRLVNSVGVIDSDYRGELFVGLHNDGVEPFHIAQGDRVAQAMILPVPAVEFEVVDELSITGRNQNGFGSTGA